MHVGLKQLVEVSDVPTLLLFVVVVVAAVVVVVVVHMR